jgi:sterol desaturase/sphingolipid hydroxylase (fatty acid hydroxylase superfamily)
MNLLSHESVFRFGVFFSVLVLMALWEMAAPRRPSTTREPLRRLNNLALVGLNTLALRLFVPLGAVGTALFVEDRAWGLFQNVSLPPWLAIGLSVVALDFAIYLQHVVFHAVPVLWRLHMVHHADLDFDVTTGLRFHTIEIVLSMGIKMAAVAVLGCPALAVVVFEVLLNATSMFNHGNVRIPGWLDPVLRLFVVTPEMHRVHHSTLPRETNSNFGFNLPWWDFLFGTYRAQPAAGQEAMTVGLSQFRDERVERLHWMLALPFVGRGAGYSQQPPASAIPGPQDDPGTTGEKKSFVGTKGRDMA